MDGNLFANCPRCSAAMEAGFAVSAAGLSFVVYEKFKHFAFLDEDLAQAGLSKILPSRAKYFRSSLCRSCQLYLIDYSKTFDRGEAEQVARPREAGS